jgi:tripartite-type tricarboxylate transporter receptor subunit TctC
MTTRRAILLALLTFGCAAIAAGPSCAQTFPGRVIKIVVPFPAGGPTDLLARLVSQRLSSILGQGVIVENEPGTGGPDRKRSRAPIRMATRCCSEAPTPMP